MSEREMEALERYRSREFHYADIECDRQALALAMLRLYPPGWNDPVTPERLVELGGTRQQHQDYCSVTYENAQSMRFCFRGKQFWIDESYENRDFPECFVPRNMQEARQLLERCGAIKEKTT